MNMGLGDKAKDVAIEHVKQKAARDILNGIKEWRTNKIETAKRRWIFELIQNAIDTAKARGKDSLKIEIVTEENFVKFKHNGGYFTLDEISAVIYGGSTKPYAPESEYIGRFGTGFLVTHVVNQKVKIEGFVCDNDQIYEFELQINRQSDNESEISKNIEGCFQQLNNAKAVDDLSELSTTYTYYIDDKLSQSAVHKGIEELKRDISFILAFNDIISEVRINDEIFKIENIQRIEDLIFKCKIKSKIIYVKINDDYNIQIAILIDENNELSNLKDYPKVFIGMPLTETADYINVPFSMNSVKFDSAKERDALSSGSEINRELLECAFEEYKTLIQKISETEDNLKGLYNAVFVKLIPKDHTEQNPLWGHFNELLIEKFQEILTGIPIVKTRGGDKKTLNQITFPAGELKREKLEDEIFRRFYSLLSEIKQNIPMEQELDGWIQTVQNLRNIDELSDYISLYNVENMRNKLVDFVKRHENFPNFGDFAEYFKLDDGKKFLLDFFELIDKIYQKKIISPEFIDYLLPDQTGIIGPLSWDGGRLYIDDDIPEDLKNILHKIGWEIKQELVHNEFVKFQIVQDYIRDKWSVDTVLENALKRDDIELKEDAVKQERWEDDVLGWIALFWWCVKNEKLLNNFPVITKYKKIRRIEDLNKETILIPFQYLGIDEKYEEIYPDTRIIHKKYFENFGNTETNIESIREYGCFITNLPLYTNMMSISYNKLKSIILSDSEISKISHNIEVDEDVISYLPFWNEVIGWVSEYQDRGKLLFEFIISYLLDKDKSWEEKDVHVRCSCREREHNIIPSYWLASLKTDAWLPFKIIKEEEEKIEKRVATKEGIENLFGEELEKFIREGGEKICDFLKHFGFDELDLKIKLKGIKIGKPESEIRGEVAKLVDISEHIEPNKLQEIVSQNPEALKEAIDKALERVRKEPLKDENKEIGENLEEVIKRIVEREGLETRPIYKGGDLEIWPEDEGWDSGAIEIEPYLLEIKFTSGSRVHLSKAQSNTAREKRENYIVLVVENRSNLRDKLKSIDESSITEEIVPNVIENSHIIEEIYSKLGEIPNPDEIEPDIHGYWIKRKLWDDKNDILEWLRERFGDGV